MAKMQNEISTIDIQKQDKDEEEMMKDMDMQEFNKEQTN